MDTLLFPEFLSDTCQYEKAESYWRQMWTEALCAAGQSKEWRSPWLNTTFGDGTPCRDGNPIFSAVNERRKIGVRVLQYVRTSPEEIDLDWWVDSFGEAADSSSIRELVISCELSDRTAGQVRDLLQDWLVKGAVATATV